MEKTQKEVLKMTDVAAEKVTGSDFGNWAFALFLILILLVFAFGFFFI